MSNLLGLKYQTYEGDTLKIYRLVRFRSKNIVILQSENDNSSKEVSMNDLLNKYVKIVPDAFMNILITDLEAAPDVYICINKSVNLNNGRNEPDIILRQNAFSLDNYSYSITDNIKIGLCITENLCFSDAPLKSYMEFKDINYSDSIALYVDDKIDDILKIISDKTNRHIEMALQKIKTYYEKTPNVIGYVPDLKSLLLNNNFIFHYRNIFNILQLDWEIDIGPESHNKDGDIVLNDRQIHKIEDELRKYITDIKVIKYDKDIDISRIVSIPHLMVSDKNENIYLIAYAIIGTYPVDNDILKAMKH